MSRPWAALAAPLLLLASCRLELDYDKFAIVYGLSYYQGVASPDLNYCDEDALEMRDLLESQGYTVITRISVDSTSIASYEQLKRDFSDVAAQVREEDLFLFYFSGHGYQTPSADPAIDEDSAQADSPDEALVLFDEAKLNPVYYRDDELAADLRSVPCTKRVVIVDACNSGGMLGNQLEQDAIPSRFFGAYDGVLETVIGAISLYSNFEGYGSDVTPLDALVIAAAGERESSYEDSVLSPLGFYHGIFTYFFLRAADEADRNFDGYVTVGEAYAYTLKAIRDEWNASFGYPWNMFEPHVSGGPVDYVLFGF